ncbi:MAG: molybdopterin molybdotransferase MoeA [bacterium]|nr:molybdopterin molybdotransferase MoeA [bacterium]
MRSVGDHLQACLEIVGPLPPLAVALPDAVGCVLADDVVAPSDLPVTDRAATDGYAVRSSDVTEADVREVSLVVVDDVRAGSAGPVRLPAGAAVLIASGAPLPEESDAVVELAFTDRGRAKVGVRRAVSAGSGVRRRASEASAGEVVLRAGERVGPRELALVAALGRGRIEVHPKPRVVIISVGDELVEPGKPARAGQVFDANSHALASGVADAGAVAIRVGAAPDSYGALRELIEDQLVRADLVITTGGLSLGEGDTVSDVIGPLGNVRFDDVALSPGRRLGVGTLGEEEFPTPVLCLPGDPVAVQVAYEAFVRPALLHMAGHPNLYRPTVRARAGSEWASAVGVREFVPVRLVGSPREGYRWDPVARAGALTGLVRANAYAVIPEGTGTLSAGAEVPCLLLEE